MATIKEINYSDSTYGILTLPKEIDLKNIAGKKIIIKDSLGETEAKVHNTINRIDGLTNWHRTRMLSIGAKISIKYDESDKENDSHIIYIDFLSGNTDIECEMISIANTNYLNFPYEKQLEDFLQTNIESIESGLRISKRQYQIGTGRIDFLCIDKDNNYVIVELKNKKTSDEVVGQISRYIGWVKKELVKNENAIVRGIIITPENDNNLEYAVSILPNVKLKYFKIKIEFSDTNL